MQPVDYVTLVAVCWELTQNWLPARVEQVIQRDRYSLALGLRTLNQRGWLTLSWHPQAARLCIEEAPPRTPDTFTLSQQLRHQLNGLALMQIAPLTPWERVVDLQFAQRPGEDPLWHLYLEVMGQYSNLILTHADQTIVTAARQVNEQQSSVRSVQTGDRYQAPPSQLKKKPLFDEPQDAWQENVSLIPGGLKKTLLKGYQGLSSALVDHILKNAGLWSEQSTTDLQPADWERLWQSWQTTLYRIQTCTFTPIVTVQGYSVLGDAPHPAPLDIQTLLAQYYGQHLHHQAFQRLHHQLMQTLENHIRRLQQKLDLFQARLQASEGAETLREQADLLMAYLYEWQPGLAEICLPDFETGQPITIPLNPEKNAVLNAQTLYKQHQKLKRSRDALEPLLQAVTEELTYLQQVEVTLLQLTHPEASSDRLALQEVRDELIQQGYLQDPDAVRSRVQNDVASQPYRYPSPSGFEVWVGRNNRQNDWLTFRVASDYDLWLHTQEIPGSHVLLRLPPGATAEDQDIQFAANLAAYFSRGRHSEQVPVVFTEPRYVFKPKGAQPGMVIYQQERVCWGQPLQITDAILAQTMEVQMRSERN